MPKVFRRTEDGRVTYVSLKEGSAEMSRAQMDEKREVREMFSGSTGARITYRDGRVVLFLKVDAPEEKPASKTPRIVTVKGRNYVVSNIIPARPRTPESEAYVDYWSARDGKRFGPVRSAKASDRPGTVGRAIWEEVAK